MLALTAVVLLGPSCATTGAAGEGDDNLPTAEVGPFRKLAPEEVTGIAPFVFDDRVARYREPAVVADADGEGAILYVVARQANGADAIVRTRADDGRAFFGSSGDFGKTAPTVLAADRAWEGASLAGPFALRAPDGFLLYYAGAGGIGVARSPDGLTFTKEPMPVLVRDPASPWETSEPHAPAVYVLPDGRFRMLYASGSSIFEAESRDGVSFTRLDPLPSTPGIEPVLGPAPPPEPGSLRPNEKPPFDTRSVGDPCASVRITPAGRLHVRVLYTGTETGGTTAIGFAARYGDSGVLVRQATPVYSVGAGEAAPALLELEGSSYLYVQQERRVDERLTYTAIAAAFAPGGAVLPPPSPFPDRP